jgi:hypothetical protein
MCDAYVLSGKIGDILNSAALLYKKFQETKSPTVLVTSKQYSHVVNGIEYIRPDVLDEDWQNLEIYIKYAKRKYDRVFIPQTYGKTTAIQHRHASWQMDAYARCGSLHWFDRLPLVIPRPSNAKDLVARHMGQRPTILFADKGESSQFESSDYLAQKLESEFGASHQIVRLSSIRLEKFTDFVALYDAAACLIVTETSHLHLSKACDIPIFALATDKPERWHGSAWSNKFKLHIRYSQFKRREMELIEGIRSVL